jgi:hypothetical protein
LDAATAQPTVRPKPPVEVVLPTMYYVVLIAEAAALVWLYRVREISAGGAIGHTIGWVGTGSMCLMHVYSIRRRVRALRSWGRLSTWLHVHIFLGLQGALLVCFHSAHLQTLSNISGITITFTLIVVASGMFGRYLYSLLPKSLSGERLTAHQIEEEMAELAPLLSRSAQPAIEAAMKEYGEATRLTGKLGFGGLIAEDLRARRSLRHLEQALKQARRKPGSTDLDDFAAAMRRRALLARRLAMLTGAERTFRFWHVLHKPLTFLLLGAVVLHVVAHYVYAARFSG